MSQLQKAISRIQRREGARLGFGPVARERPRAMLAGAFAEDAAGIRAAIAAGADVVVVRAESPAAARDALADRSPQGAAVGVMVTALDSAAAGELQALPCDFVVAPAAGTAAAAVDPEKMGFVLATSFEASDGTLRALAPLGFDALLVEIGPGEMSLASQLDLVRLSSFAGTPLLVSIAAVPAVGELRVLRDAGSAGVLLAAGAPVKEVEQLVANLKEVPPPRRPRREGGDMVLVPARSAGPEAGSDDDDDGEEDRSP